MIRDSGREIGAKEAIAKNLLRSIDLLPGMYAAGILSIFVSQQNKRLGDHLAGTVVVHERRPAESQPFWNTREDDSNPFPGIEQVTPQEEQMIETFLLRRRDLPPAVRAQSAQRIADHLATKLQATGEQKRDLEEFAGARGPAVPKVGAVSVTEGSVEKHEKTFPPCGGQSLPIPWVAQKVTRETIADATGAPAAVWRRLVRRRPSAR